MLTDKPDVICKVCGQVQSNIHGWIVRHKTKDSYEWCTGSVKKITDEQTVKYGN